MKFHQHKNFEDQVERPDFRFWQSAFLMICGFVLILVTHNPVMVKGERLAVDDSQSNNPPSQTNVKDMISADINLIKKLSQEEVQSLWGLPDFIRGEADIVIWQYKSTSCIVDIYWEEKERAGAVIQHISLRGENNKDCIRNLF